MKKTRVTIVGAGFVGATCAYAVALKNIVDEVCLVDLNKEKSESEALDIAHGAAILGNTLVKSSSYEEASNSDIIVITAGIQPKVGESRLDVLERSLNMYKNIIPTVCKYNKDAILLIVGNPVDILTYYAYKLSGFPKERLISSGTVIDSNRLRYYIANYLKVKYSAVEGIIIGEHGDSQVVLWDTVRVYNMGIKEYCIKYNIEFNDNIKETLEETVKKSGFDVVKGKGYTNFGIGEAVARIVKAIITNENVLLPVGNLYSGEFGIEEIIMSAPSIVNKNGAVEIINFNLSKDEQEKIKLSAKVLKDLIKHNLK